MLALLAVQGEGDEAASSDCKGGCKTKSQYESMLKRDIGTGTFLFENDLIYTKINLRNPKNK